MTPKATPVGGNETQGEARRIHADHVATEHVKPMVIAGWRNIERVVASVFKAELGRDEAEGVRSGDAVWFMECSARALRMSLNFETDSFPA